MTLQVVLSNLQLGWIQIKDSGSSQEGLLGSARWAVWYLWISPLSILNCLTVRSQVGVVYLLCSPGGEIGRHNRLEVVVIDDRVTSATKVGFWIGPNRAV